MIQIQRTAELMAGLPPLPPDFLKLTADAFRINVRKLFYRRGAVEVSRARQAGMWAAKRYGYTFEEVATIFNRDSTTCVHGVRQAAKRRHDWPWYAEASDLILLRARG